MWCLKGDTWSEIQLASKQSKTVTSQGLHTIFLGMYFLTKTFSWKKYCVVTHSQFVIHRNSQILLCVKSLLLHVYFHVFVEFHLLLISENIWFLDLLISSFDAVIKIRPTSLSILTVDFLNILIQLHHSIINKTTYKKWDSTWEFTFLMWIIENYTWQSLHNHEEGVQHSLYLGIGKPPPWLWKYLAL